MLLLRTILLRTLLRRLRVLLPPLPAANDLRHDLRDCDDGALFVVSVHLPRMPRLLPRQVREAERGVSSQAIERKSADSLVRRDTHSLQDLLCTFLI